MASNLTRFLSPTSGDVIPFYEFTLFFERRVEADLLIAYLTEDHRAQTGRALAPLSLPLGLVFSTTDVVTEIELRSNVVLRPAAITDFEWNLVLPEQQPIPFLSGNGKLWMMMWSQA